MVVAIEPAAGSKNSADTIARLALEPVRIGGGIETMWFGPGRHVIGSSADCSHSLGTAGIQPRHCEIRLEAGHATLRAIDFRTWLNNGPVRQAELRSGDRLIVGPLEFRVALEIGSSRNFAADEDQPLPERRPTAPIAAATVSPNRYSPPAVDPEFVAQSVRRTAEMENRMAELEGKLAERAFELDARDQAVAALEADLVRRSARVRELDSSSVRRGTLLSVQETAPGPETGGSRRQRARARPATAGSGRQLRRLTTGGGGCRGGPSEFQDHRRRFGRFQSRCRKLRFGGKRGGSQRA